MKQVLIQKGKVLVEEVPAPGVEPGTVLVSVARSCISVGTEMSGVRASGEALWKKALKQPDKVRKVLKMAATEGLGKTRSMVKGKLESGNPTGYSAAGVVLAVGEGVTDIAPGDRVACAGAQCAHHAEVIRVPRNLTVPVPDGLEFDLASTVTLGAIALQGVRRANPTLGETFVVVGLGILGQMTVQMLKANGCRVIGTDLDQGRIAEAVAKGMDWGLGGDVDDGVSQVARLTDGVGADGVIVTAASPSDAIMSTAFQYCRRKGRVVLVGDVGLNLNREDFYTKELDFFISTSYGPGRYDDTYELKGLDYPVSYVRWTENRNMSEYLRMLADGRVRISDMISAIHPLEEAPRAYESLKGGADRPLIVLLSYPDDIQGAPGRAAATRRIDNPQAPGSRQGKVRLALVGAGGFARGMHLPNLQALKDRYHLQAVVSRTGHNAQAAATQFGAGYAATDYREVLDDPEVDVVLLATRHDLHCAMTLQALEKGKHVLVEKPLALNPEELESISAFYQGREGQQVPVLMTGFNRRFSPFARSLKKQLQGRSNPMVVNYTMNAGYIPLDHWVHGPEGGGRNIGEGCHIYDLFTYLTGARVTGVQARSIQPATAHYSPRDNFTASISFDDGSLCTLTYTALGSTAFAKERMDVFVDGKVYHLHDYKTLEAHGGGRGVSSKMMDKGQKDELAALADCLQKGAPWPIELWEQLQATQISFEVEKLLGE